MLSNDIENQYEILFDEYKDDSLVKIRLTSDRWNDIVYNYNVVNFVETDEKNEEVTLNFEYDIISTPVNFNVDELTFDDKISFESHLGEILQDIIMKSLEYHDSRTEHPDKSDSQ